MRMSIKIKKIREILFAVFIVICVCDGFIEFPAKIVTYLWNYTSKYFAIPMINIWQGLLLWIVIALLIYLSNKAEAWISISSPRELTDDEMAELLQRIKTHQIKPLIVDSDDKKHS